MMAAGPPRADLPLPDKPPYTAFLGSLSFDVTEGDIADFFAPHKVSSCRVAAHHAILLVTLETDLATLVNFPNRRSASVSSQTERVSPVDSVTSSSRSSTVSRRPLSGVEAT